MAIIKCKMCGGDLFLVAGQSVAECEYCGSRQTVPAADNEKKLTLFARASRLHSACEFDKASGIYEAIVADFPEEAEAYWGLVLCKYGIEYVDDPVTGKKVPTCHRSNFDSVLEDSNYDQTIENADEVAISVYRQEATQIEGIRREILTVSNKEKPYDIFICYKETDINGNRSVDSRMAQDIYDALTANGYRVFFSRISLEEKLGQAYEPFIFAALNSAKIMLAVGTCYEHYNAVWVKNEWSRYLKIIAQDKSKYLIPCYKNIDAYDIPKEFAHLQGQDMGKVGAIADLLRGIEKLLPKNAVRDISGNRNIAALLERGHMALEDEDWAEADRFFEEVLNNEPKNPNGYLGKLLAEYRITIAGNLGTCAADFTSSSNYQKALRFANSEVQNLLEDARKDKIYYTAIKLLEENTKSSCQKAAAQLTEIPGWRDTDKLTEVCQSRIETFSGKKSNNSKKQRNSINFLPIAVILVIVLTTLFLFLKSTDQLEQLQSPANTLTETDSQYAAYQKAIALMEEGKFPEAIEAFSQLSGYLDSDTQKEYCRVATENAAWSSAAYLEAETLLGNGKLVEAAMAFGKLGWYDGARERSFALWSAARATETISAGQFRTMAVQSTGNVLTTDGDITGAGFVAVSDGSWHYMGLREDGTLNAKTSNDIMPGLLDYVKGMYGGLVERNQGVHDWHEIQSVSAGDTHTVGLRKDGTVVAVGDNHYGRCEVDDWKNIQAISAGFDHTVGLLVDGTVLSVGGNKDVLPDTTQWKDIVAISAGKYFTVGLRMDGTVLAAGKNEYGQCDVNDWHDIIAISAGNTHTVLLRLDGTVVAVGGNEYGQCDVDEWRDIVAIDAGGWHTVGLKADGTMVAVGHSGSGRCDVAEWKNVKLPHKEARDFPATWTDIKLPNNGE